MLWKKVDPDCPAFTDKFDFERYLAFCFPLGQSFTEHDAANLPKQPDLPAWSDSLAPVRLLLAVLRSGGGSSSHELRLDSKQGHFAQCYSPVSSISTSFTPQMFIMDLHYLLIFIPFSKDQASLLGNYELNSLILPFWIWKNTFLWSQFTVPWFRYNSIKSVWEESFVRLPPL